jgi:hypothetical protein
MDAYRALQSRVALRLPFGQKEPVASVAQMSFHLSC